MSNPKEQKETVSLIEDFQRSRGYIEWYVPRVTGLIQVLEEEICDVSTSSEDTARKKIERAVLLSVLRLPDEIMRGCNANLEAYVDKARGVKRND